MTTQALQRIGTYERVSSEEQRERNTIRIQTEGLARSIELETGVELVQRYVDDGISGTIPMSERPAGSRLLADARRGLFDEIWVYSIDRLGRDDVDPLIVWRELEDLGVSVRSITEGVSSPFEYHIRVAMAAEERRAFLARSAAGMERAVREGRYPGGIVAFGYAAEGERHKARLVIDDRLIWGDLTAGDVVRRMFEWSHDGWSDLRIANELNDLGVPTAYAIAKRGVRDKRTQEVWRQGRVNQILASTTYFGEYQYGKRSTRPGKEIITVRVPAIVSKEFSDAVREIRGRRSRKPAGQRMRYLLRSLLKCEICGRNYTGTTSHGDVWYRCNGQLVGRGPLEGRCPAKGVKGTYVDPVVKEDIEAFLRNPGDLLEELAAELEHELESEEALGEAEQETLRAAMDQVDARRNRLLDLYLNGPFGRDELDRRMAEIEGERTAIQRRLDDLGPAPTAEPFDPDLLPELKRRLDDGLSDEQWHEIVSLLVRRIVIHTTPLDDGKKQAKAVIEYAFDSVVENVTGRGSSPPPS